MQLFCVFDVSEFASNTLDHNKHTKFNGSWFNLSVHTYVLYYLLYIIYYLLLFLLSQVVVNEWKHLLSFYKLYIWH